MAESRTSRWFFIGFSSLFILGSVIGLATTNKPVTLTLIFKLGLVDVGFVALFGGLHLAITHQIKLVEASLKNLSWRDRVKVRRAFNRKRLPAAARLKPAALKYARAQADYSSTFRGNIVEPVAFGLAFAIEVTLLNIAYNLLRHPQSADIFLGVPSLAVIIIVFGLMGWSRKRAAESILRQNKK